jgi:hypothetical protein
MDIHDDALVIVRIASDLVQGHLLGALVGTNDAVNGSSNADLRQRFFTLRWRTDKADHERSRVSTGVERSEVFTDRLAPTAGAVHVIEVGDADLSANLIFRCLANHHHLVEPDSSTADITLELSPMWKDGP